MPALFVFLLKVNIALLLFCAGYYLVLRHLTFYTLNRVYLVTAILFASAYPQINLSAFVQRHQQLTIPVQAVVFNWQKPAEIFIKPLTQPNYWYWVEVVFWAGAALLAIRLLMQLYSLYRLYRNSKPAQIYDHEVRVITGNSGPFSFWKSIYVNPANHEPADLKAILLHEQIHISEWHTLDILLAELSTIFYWFNPGIWLMKKAVRENIEFITDQKILKKGVDSKQYQYSLVSVSFAASSNSIVNHFNISTIKKRIIMMNAKRSSKFTLTRYAFLVPAVIVLLLVFSISKAALVKKSANRYYNALAVSVKAGNAAISKSISSINIGAVAGGGANLNDRKKINARKTTDTIKKGAFFLRSSHPTDSLNYVINGVKVTKADFMALDQRNVYSIEMMPAEQARKIIDKIDTKYSVLFVTTGNSERGKRFKEKIDKLNGTGTVNSNIIAIGKGSDNGSAASVTVAGDDASGESVGSGVIVSTASSGSSNVAYTIVNRKHKAMKIKTRSKAGFSYMADSLIVSNDDEPAVFQINGSDTLKTDSFSPFKSYTISPKNKGWAIKPKLTTKSFYRYNKTSSSPFTFYSSNLNEDSNIEHLSSKMIMIDGKEAAENDLKKLSAADIESMSVKSGDEITEKYGDKAKNGVVFITRKKAVK